MANEVELEIACKNVFQITSRRYRQLASDGTVPEVIKGKIDILNASKALIEYYRKLSAGQGSLSLTDERVRLTRINADRKELELKKEQEEVVYASDVTKTRAEIYQKIRTKLLSMPIKLPPLIIGQKKLTDIKNRVDIFTREVLNELADIDIKSIGRKKATRKKSNRSGKGSSGDVQAAAKTHRKRVQRKRKSVKS